MDTPLLVALLFSPAPRPLLGAAARAPGRGRYATLSSAPRARQATVTPRAARPRSIPQEEVDKVRETIAASEEAPAGVGSLEVAVVEAKSLPNMDLLRAVPRPPTPPCAARAAEARTHRRACALALWAQVDPYCVLYLDRGSDMMWRPSAPAPLPIPVFASAILHAIPSLGRTPRPSPLERHDVAT